MSTEPKKSKDNKDTDKKKKVIISIVIALIAIIAIIIFSVGYSKGFRTIKLLEIFKTVNFDRGSQKDVAVYDGMSLKAGDTIRTGDDESFARLVLDDDKYVYIEENSEVNFELAGRKKTSKTTLHLNYGAIYNEINSKLTDQQSYEVKSPNSLMAVRGTKFRVSTYIGPDGVLYTRISVLEGQVQCWLIYPDGTISDESHMAEVGTEVLIYYDEENGITDFAESNDTGAYLPGIDGKYVSPIRYAQLPKQILKFLYKHAKEEGATYPAISADELNEYVVMEASLEEPVLEGYREYIEEHPVDDSSKEETKEQALLPSDNEDTELVPEETPSPTPTPLGGNDAGTTDNNNGNDANNNNANDNVNTPKEAPTPTPSLAEQIEQYFKEILAHPDVYRHLIPTPTPEPVIEVASSNDDEEEHHDPAPAPEPEPEQNNDSNNDSNNNDNSGSSGDSGNTDPGNIDPTTPEGQVKNSYDPPTALDTFPSDGSWSRTYDSNGNVKEFIYNYEDDAGPKRSVLTVNYNSETVELVDEQGVGRFRLDGDYWSELPV